MIDLKSESSSIYRIILPVMQVLVCILLLLALIFNNRLESISDFLRNAGIAIQFFSAIILGLKELMVKKNKVTAYFYFGFIFAVLAFIIYIATVY